LARTHPTDNGRASEFGIHRANSERKSRVELRPVGIDEVVGAARAKLVGTLADESYARSVPRLINAGIVDPADLKHFERLFQQGRQSVRGMRLFEIRDAVILRQGEVVLDGRELIIESVRHSQPAVSAIAAVLEKTAGALAKQFTDNTEEKHAFGLLLNQWSFRNYGHFLLEILPKAAFAQANFDLSQAALLVHGDINRATADLYRQSLRRLRLSQPLTPMRARTRVDKLIFATTAGTHGVNKSPYAVRQARELFLPAEPARHGGTAARRLWIRRGETYRRRLVNQEELIALATQFGFEPITPEIMPVAQQAALFSEASACIGPIGAGFTNIVFCRPGTVVMTLSPNFGRETFFYDIASIVDAEYSYVFGEAIDPAQRYNSDFSVPLDALRTALERIAGQRA